jgi:hypothetical protein
MGYKRESYILTDAQWAELEAVRDMMYYLARESNINKEHTYILETFGNRLHRVMWDVPILEEKK